MTQPTRYENDCELVDATAERIVGLSYDDKGASITGKEFAEKEFIIATNTSVLMVAISKANWIALLSY